MRAARALPVLVVLMVACSGPAANQSTSGTDQSENPDASVAAASTGGEPSSAASTGGGGGGDVEAVAQALVPPNSNETINTSQEGLSFIMYESTDSIDSLKSFYESAIPAAGMKIISTSTIAEQNSVSFVFAESDTSSFGGAVNIFPSGNGDNSGVQVTVGASQ
jgi:uncharacterized protein YfiM (DUF2279 family)